MEIVFLEKYIHLVIIYYGSCTYRAVYAVKIGERVYVLHCFQKKSQRGIKTPKKEVDLIKKRLKMAQELEEYCQ